MITNCVPACAWGLIHEAITSSLDGFHDAYKTQIGEEGKDCKICWLSLGCAWEEWELCRRVGLMWRGCHSRRSWDVHQCTTRDGWHVVTKQFSVGFQFPSYKPIWWFTLRRCSVCKPAKIFFTSNLVIYFFATPSIKLKLGQQIGRDYWYRTTWTNHYDRPIRNTQQQLDYIYYIPMLSQNDFLNQTGKCWLVVIEFYCADHRWRWSNNGVVR
jgi:hypothetical protein